MPRTICALICCLPLLLAACSFSRVEHPDTGRAEAMQARGLVSIERGSFEEAVPNLREAVRLYALQGEHARQGKALLFLGESYLSSGQYRDSQQTFESVLELEDKTTKAVRARALLGLGSVFTSLGLTDKAHAHIQQAVDLAVQEKDEPVLAVAYNALGNLFVLEAKPEQAIEAYKKSSLLAERTGQTSLSIRALSNAVLACVAQNSRYDIARGLAKGLDERALTLRDSYDKVLVLTNIGLAFAGLARQYPEERTTLLSSAMNCFSQAMLSAENLENLSAFSYAAGYMGGLHEEEGDYVKGLDLTRQAVFSAQKAQVPESLYLWQWQTGRILRKTGENSSAITAYRNAIYTLQSIRQEMDACPGSGGLSFKQTVSPLYFEFVDLLLSRPKSEGDAAANREDLKEAREVVELLKVAELRDYFQDECIASGSAQVTSLDEISKSVVVVYPIVLKDRTELLVSLPTGLRQITVPVSSDVLTQEILQFRRKLEKCTTNEYLPFARQLYDWLIRPVEAELKGLKVETLVFVPDGPLRTIPMAALNDGKQFLISKYAVAVTPGLSLTDPKPIQRQNTKVLAAGLTEAVQGFPPLPFVSIEMKALQEYFACDLLVNEAFKTSNLEKQLRGVPFSMMHIASHGEFDSDASKSFILTYNGRLTMDELAQYVGLFRFRKEPLELLTLSACETAAGDERAALGLAGLGIKAGARSAVATLWHVNDEASSLLVAEFYRNLQNPSLSRASALRAAQQKLMDSKSYEHPAYWSAFLLINNWL